MLPTDSTTPLLLIKPEEGIEPFVKSGEITHNAAVLESLLKQDLDINSQELEDLMDDFDIDDLMNMKKPQIHRGADSLKNGMHHAPTDDYDDFDDTDDDYVNGHVDGTLGLLNGY